MRNIVACAALAFVAVCPAAAQESLVGKYSGSYTPPSMASAGIAIDIRSVDKGTNPG